MSDLTQDLSWANMIFVPACLDELDLTPATFRVYAHIARRAGRGECFPGIDSMARNCRIHKETVVESIKELEQKKMILVLRKPGKTNRYRLTKPDLWLEPVGNGERSNDQSEMGNERVSIGTSSTLLSSQPPFTAVNGCTVVGVTESTGSTTSIISREKSKSRGSLEEIKAYAKELGLLESDGASIHDNWLANGWTLGRNKPVKDWRAAMRNWKANGWFPSQKRGLKPQRESFL